MKIGYRFGLVLAVSLFLIFPAFVFAQTTGAIEGTVSDTNGNPLPGASITVQSDRLIGTRTTVSDSEGRFRFPALPPGTYTVTASLSGFKKVERGGVVVTLSGTATVPFKLEISVTQEIVVTAGAPVVDTTSTTTGLNVRQEVIQKLPLGRNYASAVEMNPGVSFDTADAQQRALTFTIYGATSIENQYLVDGVNTTNVIRGMQGKALTQEFVEEVQVKAGGFEAEYGRAMGGIVNVVTKSGGNEFRGDAFGYFNAKSLTAAPKARAASDESYTDTSQRNIQDFGADLGGFVIKDRIWFFGAYNRVNQNVDQTQLAGTGLPNAGVTFPITFHSDLYSGKLTARPTDSTTLIGTIFGDPEIRVGPLRNFVNVNGIEPSSQNGTRKVGAADFAADATQLFGARGLLDVQYSRHRDRNVLIPDFSTTPQFRDYTKDVNNPSLSGGFGSVRGFFDDNRSTRDAVKGQGTLFLASHEIKGGVDWENNITQSTDFYSAGVRMRIYNCGTTRCPNGGFTGIVNGRPYTNVYFGHEFYTLTADKTQLASQFLPAGNTVKPHAYRLGYFLQDSWKMMPNLTLNAGLRYDQEDIRKYDGTEIFNDKVVDASGKVIQQGGQPFKLKNEWQPRIGLAWDPMNNGSMKVSASAGRFYYALPTDLTVRSYGAKIDALVWNLDPTTSNLKQDDVNVKRGAFTQGGFNPEPFQDNLKGYYQDEFAFGVEKAINPTFSIGTRYTFRKFGRAIEDRCDFDDSYPESNGNTCVIINPGSNSPFATGKGVHTCDGRDYVTVPADAPPNDCTGPPLTNIAEPAAQRKFHGLELVAKKRVGNTIWMQASYLWSHLYGNYDGAASIAQTQAPGGGQTDPGINADFDYPRFTKYAQGDLFLDHRHSFRFDGAYTIPFGLTVGLQTYLRSGGPISKYGYFNSGYVSESNFVTPRGSEGRLPWEYELNLALTYAIRVRPVTITLLAQGVNLMNRQYTRGVDQDCSVAPPAVEADTGPGSVSDCNPATNPGGANPDYRKTIWRSPPRSIRLGTRVTF